MKPMDIDMSLVDSYYTLLKSLSPNNKLELIARLSKSLKSPQTTNDSSWEDLFGSWELDVPTDEFLAELKHDRDFNRKTIEW